MNKNSIQYAVLATLLTSTLMVPTAFAKEHSHNEAYSHHDFQQQEQHQTTVLEESDNEQENHAENHSEDHSNSNKTMKAQHKQEVQALHAELAKLHQIQEQERSVHHQLNADIQSLISRMQSDVLSGNTTDLSSLTSGLTSIEPDLQQAVQEGNTANQDVNQAKEQAKSTTGIQNAITQIQKVEALKLQKITAMQKAIRELDTLLSTSTASSSTSTTTNSVYSSSASIN